MAEYTSNALQTVAAGQNVLLTETPVCGSNCINHRKDLKERTRSERGITMNKGRKTTQEERTEIVAYCIENV